MSTTTTRALAGESTTAAQRRASFAAGRLHGLNLDGLRELTPQGSISAMSRAEAAALLERLNTGTQYQHPRRSPRGPRRPKGVLCIVTEAQFRKVEALRIDLGWSPQKLQEWLSEHHHDDGRPMTRIDSTRDGQAVIELLKAVLSRSLEARRRKAEPKTQG